MYLQGVKELKAKGAYSLATQDGSTLYISGQLPVCLDTGELRLGSAAEEARTILHNIEAILAEYGCNRNNILKTTVFMTDANYWGDVNGVYEEFFLQNKPARSAVVVGSVPFMGFKVEIEAIATTNVVTP